MKNEVVVNAAQVISSLTLAAEFLMCAARDVAFGEDIAGDRVQTSIRMALGSAGEARIIQVLDPVETT